MKRKSSLIYLLLGAFFVLGLTGCGTLNEDENEQQVPWSRPASWEGTVPGMPNSPG
jgi:hypothetical protein